MGWTAGQTGKAGSWGHALQKPGLDKWKTHALCLQSMPEAGSLFLWGPRATPQRLEHVRMHSRLTLLTFFKNVF